MTGGGGIAHGDCIKTRQVSLCVLVSVALWGCGDRRITEVLEGSRDLPQISGRITAREALALVYPAAREISTEPILLTISSGTDINAAGRSGGWEYVFHFPDRQAQGVYSFEPRDPEADERGLRLKWRLSPRAQTRGRELGLPLEFMDSPEAVDILGRAGADWSAGDPDLTLASKRLPSGAVVWATESDGNEFAVPFADAGR